MLQSLFFLLEKVLRYQDKINNMANTKDLFQSLQSLKQHLGVISTVSEDGKVESAVVYFSFDEELNLYFLTRMGSRKYKNIFHNPVVSFIAYSEHPAQTFQFEGKASIVSDPGEQGKAFTDVYINIAKKESNNPPVSQNMDSGLAVMKISPIWARFSDYDPLRKGEEKFQEVKFD
jgi:general stress protein 26